MIKMKKMKNGKIVTCLLTAFILTIIMPGCGGSESKTAEESDLEPRNLSEFTWLLETYRNGVLANRNGEKLRTQIITFSRAEENRAYFCTTTNKPMYTQLVAFPYVSYCAYPEDWEPVLSLNGKVVFVEDRETKERVLESNYYAKNNFGSVDNPLLAVFYIDVEEIETYSTEGAFVYAAK